MVPTDCWVEMDWDTFVSQSEAPALEKAKGYYHLGYGRFENLPVGFVHASDHAMVSTAISLFCILKSVPMRMASRGSYRKVGLTACQPNLSAYVHDNVSEISTATDFASLDTFPTPALSVEVSDTSLIDDLGSKRLLYEELNFGEYWVVDVKKAEASAFKIADQGSQKIRTSLVLPGFELDVLEEALRKSRKLYQSQVGAWLMEQFRP
ncbi:MAG: Uma2 family endonuclease [Cyanobacteria bacterium J06581_3]